MSIARLLTDGDGSACPRDIHDRTAKATVGPVERQVQTWHRSQEGLPRRPGGQPPQRYLAGLALKARREVVHDDNSALSSQPRRAPFSVFDGREPAGHGRPQALTLPGRGLGWPGQAAPPTHSAWPTPSGAAELSAQG